VDQLGQRPQRARRKPERFGRRGRDRAGRLGMSGRQELASPVWPLDHQMRGALVPLAPDHPNQSPCQRMVWRRNPDSFDVTEIQVISLLVAVFNATSAAPHW